MIRIVAGRSDYRPPALVLARLLLPFFSTRADGDHMADWIFGVMDAAGYSGLTFLMWLENVFPPIPSELVMPLAGYRTQQGSMSYAGVVAAGTLGSLAGAYMFYGGAYWLGRERVESFCARHGRWIAITPKDLQRANDWFERRGAATVFFCRLVPGLRSVISIPAGLVGHNFLEFTVFTILGTAIWCAALAYVGIALGENFKQVGDYLNPVSWLIFAVVLVWYLHRVFFQTASGGEQRSSR